MRLSDGIWMANIKGIRVMKKTFLLILALSLCFSTAAFAANAKVTIKYKDGYYFGYTKNKLPHGKGTRVWGKELRYEGDWVNGKRQGQGYMLFATHLEAGEIIFEYTGQWKNDLYHGKGKLSDSGYQLEKFGGGHYINYDEVDYMYIYDDTYNGEFKNGLREGSGKYEFLLVNDETNKKLQITYQGEWKKGFMDGKGTLTRSINDKTVKYTGGFIKSMKHGKGTETIWNKTAKTTKTCQVVYKNGNQVSATSCK